MHGYDIARAAGVPWKIERAHAAMTISGFLLEVMQALGPDALVGPRAARRRRSQGPAIARGQLVAWGRKPWMGPRLRSLVRNP